MFVIYPLINQAQKAALVVAVSIVVVEYQARAVLNALLDHIAVVEEELEEFESPTLPSIVPE